MDHQEAILNQLKLILERLDRIDVRMDRLEIRMERFEVRMERLDAGMEQVEARMEKANARMDRFDANLVDMENRMMKAIRAVETALITEFQKWASPSEMRAKARAAAIRALDTEIEYHADRITNLERRAS